MAQPPLSIEDYFDKFDYLDRVEDTPNKVYCNVCQSEFTGDKAARFKRHLETQKHQNLLQSAATGYPTAVLTAMNNYPDQFRFSDNRLQCKICGYSLSSVGFNVERHNTCERHLKGIENQKTHKEYISTLTVEKLSHDLCEAFMKCDIALENVNKKPLRNFITNISGFAPQAATSIRGPQRSEVTKESVQEVMDYLDGEFTWLSADETKIDGKKVGSLIAGTLEVKTDSQGNQRAVMGRNFLIGLKELKGDIKAKGKKNANSVVAFVKECLEGTTSKIVITLLTHGIL